MTTGNTRYIFKPEQLEYANSSTL